MTWHTSSSQSCSESEGSSCSLRHTVCSRSDCSPTLPTDSRMWSRLESVLTAGATRLFFLAPDAGREEEDSSACEVNMMGERGARP